jgi:hypothetical protein
MGANLGNVARNRDPLEIQRRLGDLAAQGYLNRKIDFDLLACLAPTAGPAAFQ